MEKYMWDSPMTIFIVITCLIIFAYTLIRQRKVVAITNRISIKDYKPLKGFFNCPNCDSKMKSGFRIANQGILWTTEFKGTHWKGLTQMPLVNTTSDYGLNHVNMAWRCENCKLMLIDHNALLKH